MYSLIMKTKSFPDDKTCLLPRKQQCIKLIFNSSGLTTN